MDKLLQDKLLVKVSIVIAISIAVVDASHFRGGIISYKVNGTSGRGYTVDFSVRLAFRRGAVYCDNTLVANKQLLNVESWQLKRYRYGSVSSNSAGSVNIYCSAFSANDDWIEGYNHFIFNGSQNDLSLDFGIDSGNWIGLTGASSNAGIYLFTRSNLTASRLKNQSPVSNIPLTIYVAKGVPSVIKIPVHDPDGDVVRCRNANQQECKAETICSYWPYGTIHEEKCSISYNGNGLEGQLFPIYLKLEDYAHGTTQFEPSKSLGSVDLQFVIHIKNGDNGACPTRQVGIVSNCKVSKDFPYDLVPIPQVSYHENSGGAIVTMLCKFQFSLWKNVTFGIEWFTEGRSVKNDTICDVKDDNDCKQRYSILPTTDKQYLYFQPGHKVRCRLRMKYNIDKNYTWTKVGRDSNEYFVGIEVTSQHSPLKECKKDTKITVTFRPTVPVLGKAVSVKVLVPNFQNGVQQTKSAANTCDVKLPLGMFPNQTRELEIVGVCDNVNQWQQNAMEYHFAITDLIHTFWYNYKLPSIKVKVENSKQKECSSVTDPHYTTFDGRYYDFFPVGDYILYRNKITDTEIHTKVWRCSSAANGPTCNCGVAIREGADIIIITVCNQQLVRTRATLLRCEVRSARGLAPGTNIIRNVDGSTVTYNVVLPSGTRLKIQRDYWGISLYLKAFQLKPTDAGIFGLCGNCNDREDDEFHHGGDKQNHGNDINSFGRSWRVQGKSYFDTFLPKPPGDDSNPKKWCECPRDANNEFTDCKWSSNTFQEFGQKSGVDLAKQFQKGNGEGRRRRSIEETIYDDEDIMDNEDNPSFFVDEHDEDFASKRIRARRAVMQEFMSRENATQYCKRLIEDTTAGKKCGKVPGFNLTIAMLQCTTDLQLTGDVRFASAAFDSMKETCEEVALKNVSLYQKDASGELKPPEDIGENLCPSDCSNHGNCTNRTCICEEGYTSNDCSMSINAVPELFGIYDGGLCDIRKRPCKKTDIFGQDFIDSENLTCHAREFKVFPSNWVVKPSANKLPGRMIDIYGVRCELPDPPTKLGDYNSEGTPAGGLWISISNDGKHKSQRQMRFVSYDSVCMACNKTGNCSLKDNSCLIRGHCFAANQSNPRDWCQQCMPGSSQHSWTRRKDNQSPSFDKNQTTRSAIVGEYLPLQLKASDPDNRPVKYSLISSTASSGYTFTPSGLLKWNVTSRDNKEFTFKVTDECNATDVITITIRIVVCPCKNGGKCLPHPYHPRGSGKYSCQCRKGFTGDKCETNINDCVSINCGNGTCIDGINNYTCQCNVGFKGFRCNEKIYRCTNESCFAGVNCTEIPNGISCGPCPVGFSGDGKTCQAPTTTRIPTTTVTTKGTTVKSEEPTTKETTTEPTEKVTTLKSKEPTTSETTTNPVEETQSTTTKAEYTTTETPEELKVKAEIRLIMTWKNVYENKNSEEYRLLVQRIENEIWGSYKNAGNENLKEVTVTSLRPGSIVAEFQLAFKNKQTDPLLPLKKSVQDGKMGTLSVDSNSLKLTDSGKTGKTKDNRLVIILVPVVVAAVIILSAVIVIICRSKKLHSYRLSKRRSSAPVSRLGGEKIEMKETWTGDQTKTVENDFEIVSSSKVNPGFQ